MFGRTDPDPSFEVAGDLDAPLGAEPLPVPDAYALAQQNRPDIQSLRLQLAKAEADTVVEHRKAYPAMSPMTGFTRQFQGRALGQENADTWNVAMTMEMPFFNRNQGNRLKADSVAVQNRFNLQAGLADLLAEVTQTAKEFEIAHKSATAISQEQLELARSVRERITKGYQFGGKSIIDVFDAQRSYQDTYRNYINSRANYWRSLYRFSSVIGKQINHHDEPQ
jgi:cobalt-zinc-cadmium efflux system outer membrane protein